MQEVETAMKVIIVGNGCVGKTSMITRYCKGLKTENYKKTIGTDFMEKEMQVKSTNESVRMMLWDTAGQEMFAKLTKAYYKGADAVVYVFSTTDRESFLEIDRWRRKVEDECGTIVAVLVQNKTDLIDQAKMNSQEVEDLARRLNMKLYRTCVKDNVLVDDVFDYVAESFLKKGGESNADSVPSIQSLGKKEEKEEERKEETVSGTIILEPSRRRTGGKKNQCQIL